MFNMTNKISFKNLDSKVDLAFDLDKGFIVIFGKKWRRENHNFQERT